MGNILFSPVFPLVIYRNHENLNYGPPNRYHIHNLKDPVDFTGKYVLKPLFLGVILIAIVLSIVIPIIGIPDLDGYIKEKEYFSSPIEIYNIEKLNDCDCRLNIQSEPIYYNQTIQTLCSNSNSTIAYFSHSIGDSGNSLVSFTEVYYDFNRDKKYNELVETIQLRKIVLASGISVILVDLIQMGILMFRVYRLHNSNYMDF